jgi:hypothetical protein
MKIKEITVEKSKTINLGDYNSVRVGYGITIELEGADINKQTEDAYSLIDTHIESQLLKEGAEQKWLRDGDKDAKN